MYHPVVAALLLGASLALSSCNSKPATDAHDEEAHATQPKPAPVATPPNLRVPVEALIRDGDASYLWTQTGARQYRRVRVSTGEGSASSVPITAGRPGPGSSYPGPICCRVNTPCARALPTA